jgi:hypothetical protein
MEACVDLRGPRMNLLAIHRRWFLTSGVVACRGVVPSQESSLDTQLCAGLTHLTLCVPVLSSRGLSLVSRSSALQLEPAGESLRHMDATLSSRPVMVMPSHCAGDALDPPLWNIPNTPISLSLARVGDHFETFCLPHATVMRGSPDGTVGPDPVPQSVCVREKELQINTRHTLRCCDDSLPSR